jgi:catechol 2,3-dioxygenase-like lactoylglutathione lyase family enzyme
MILEGGAGPHERSRSGAAAERAFARRRASRAARRGLRFRHLIAKDTTMHTILAAARAVLVALVGALAAAGAAHAELAEPNAAGVAMGHLHFTVRDVATTQRFWVTLGGKPVKLFGTTDGVEFPGVIVLLRQGEPSGLSDGAVVNHVAFRVRSTAALEQRGLKLVYNTEVPGVAYVLTPDGERVELFDDERATNLGFTIDGGGHDAAAERHNRKLDVPIAAHHIHLNVPEADVGAAKRWYAQHFGGIEGKRWHYEAVDLPGINLNFSGVAAARAPTRGRHLDHIGFEVEHLEAFCKKLEAQGIRFDRPYSRRDDGFGLAFLTDPWGTYIELTEGLRAL